MCIPNTVHVPSFEMNFILHFFGIYTCTPALNFYYNFQHKGRMALNILTFQNNSPIIFFFCFWIPVAWKKKKQMTKGIMALFFFKPKFFA